MEKENSSSDSICFLFAGILSLVKLLSPPPFLPSHFNVIFLHFYVVCGTCMKRIINFYVQNCKCGRVCVWVEDDSEVLMHIGDILFPVGMLI